MRRLAMVVAGVALLACQPQSEPVCEPPPIDCTSNSDWRCEIIVRECFHQTTTRDPDSLAGTGRCSPRLGTDLWVCDFRDMRTRICEFVDDGLVQCSDSTTDYPLCRP